jgi:CTP:molybdopterin cytidylyltransferase MocA
MPAAVLAGGASQRMGRPKAGLEYGGVTLLEHQTRRLAKVFSPFYAMLKAEGLPVARARVVFDRTPARAAARPIRAEWPEARGPSSPSTCLLSGSVLADRGAVARVHGSAVIPV